MSVQDAFPAGLYAPKAVLEFPRLEYIPIAVETLAFGYIPPEGPSAAQLEPITGLGRYRSLVDGHNLALAASRPPEPEQNLTVLALNLHIEACFYRGLRAVLVGRPAPGRAHLFEMTRRYFYKDAFVIEAVDDAGTPLARATVSLVPQPQRSPRIGLFPS